MLGVPYDMGIDMWSAGACAVLGGLDMFQKLGADDLVFGRNEGSLVVTQTGAPGKAPLSLSSPLERFSSLVKPTTRWLGPWELDGFARECQLMSDILTNSA